MDRLVCGDVRLRQDRSGAARAAFVAAMGGEQVAVVVPATPLARGIIAASPNVFRASRIKVRQLSRFVDAKDAAGTKEALADGTVLDIVIGTHALLAGKHQPSSGWAW